MTLTHDGRKLVGSVYLKGDEVGPMTVRLQPWGTVTGRIVDEEGRPARRPGAEQPRRRLSGAARRPGHAAGGRLHPGILVGRDGRFRIEGLIPGLKYGATASQGFVDLGEVFRDVTVAPGEVKDLGDLKAAPLRRDD